MEEDHYMVSPVHRGGGSLCGGIPLWTDKQRENIRKRNGPRGLRNSTQAIKRASPGIETQDKHYQKSNTGVPVAPQKGHVSSKKQKTKQNKTTLPSFILRNALVSKTFDCDTSQSSVHCMKTVKFTELIARTQWTKKKEYHE